jgi:hypothetical protein
MTLHACWSSGLADLPEENKIIPLSYSAMQVIKLRMNYTSWEMFKRNRLRNRVGSALG